MNKSHYYEVYNPYLKKDRWVMLRPHTEYQIFKRRIFFEATYGAGIEFTKLDKTGEYVDMEILNIEYNSDEWFDRIKKAKKDDVIRDRLKSMS